MKKNMQNHNHQNVILLIEYFKKNNKWPTINPEVKYKGVNLSNVISNIRYKNNSLSDEDILKLKKLKFQLEPTKIIHKKILLLTEYYNQYKQWPKEQPLYYKEVDVGTFFKEIQLEYIPLSKSEIALLEYLRFPFKKKRDCTK